MFYEEAIIDNVLHTRSHPDAQFEPVSPEALTGMLLEARREQTPSSGRFTPGDPGAFRVYPFTGYVSSDSMSPPGESFGGPGF